ncbi:MAG: nucleotidyltransferase family protein [Armatimonadota bacterium]|nr:nucleotidyltransferase family protein [Armatimonadota bacterium]
MRAMDIIGENREGVLKLASKYGAYNIRVFGSAARGDDTESSDIDFLISMEEGRSLLDQAGLLTDLSELLGRKVDVVTEDSIYWLIRRRILKEARPI